MLRSSTIQQILINQQPPSHPLLYMPISFPYFMDHPHQMSINVHRLHLVHGLGSICYGGHSGQERRHVVLSCWALKPAQLGLPLHLPSSLRGLSSVGLGSSCYSAFYNTTHIVRYNSSNIYPSHWDRFGFSSSCLD